MRFRNPLRRAPAPPGFGGGKVVPEVNAWFPSLLVLHWLSPLLTVGYSRPLEEDDLWTLPEDRLTRNETEELEKRFFVRCEPSKRPYHLKEELEALEAVSGKPSPAAASADPEKGDDQATEETAEDSTANEKAPKSPYDESLIQALHLMFFKPIWISGFMQLVSDTLQTTTPLVSKVLLTWLAKSYAFAKVPEGQWSSLGLGSVPAGVGYGIGVAFGIFAMQEGASLLMNHAAKISMTVGQGVRTALIGAVVRKSLRLSGKARQEHTVGQIITMISSDATRLELLMRFVHQCWISPIQLLLGIGLLIGTLGYSALAGLGFMILSFPIQGIFIKIMFVQKEKAIKITDKRVQLTNEVLQGIRLIKCYGWDMFYLDQISLLREREMKANQKSVFALSWLICIFYSVPILSTIISFITYAVTGHDLDVATVFTALQLFNNIRMPLLMLPMAMSSVAQAMISVKRAGEFMASEELPPPYLPDPTVPDAVRIDGDFTWEPARNTKAEELKKAEEDKAKKNGSAAAKKEKPKDKKSKKTGKDEKTELPSTSSDVDPAPEEKGAEPEEPPFELKGLKFSASKGSFVGIIGRIGSGKSSLLQSLIGEMRKTNGQVVVNGTVSYVPQTAWIQNATIEENILFGQPKDDARFKEVVNACNLRHDIDALPHREATEIGEKGINLSGGQKARVSLARAAYSDSDIVLLDDPLSAVDAYVGRAILDECLLNGPLASRTRILVTHALHVLDKLDYIYVMENGKIVEQGTYQDLIRDGDAFSRLIDEYGAVETAHGSKITVPGRRATTTGGPGEDDKHAAEVKDVLMQLEERSTGAVQWETYKRYIKYVGGMFLIPLIGGMLLLNQAIATGDTVWLSLWTSNGVDGFKSGHYMAVYAAFGVTEALFALTLSYIFFSGGLRASLKMFKAALGGIFRSPLSFFDTTPMGRILSRLTKDQETLDNELPAISYNLLSISTSVFGVIALVFYTFPYLGIAFPPLILLYYVVALYYRATSVETKRLDSILRSALYATVSEMLSGLATIRAYKVQETSVARAGAGLDVQNRAHYMTITVQRWLAIRLDFFGNLLVLGIGLFAAGFRHSVNPAKTGVVLSYTLGFTMIFSEIVSQFAQNEQNMNAVERVLHYTDLPSEAALETDGDPDVSWPQDGAVTFKNVDLAYRPGLPLVLKDVSFSIKPREKVGIVGRTGAGKSSLIQALLRTVELSRGSIEIDGVDIGQIGLATLRARLALVPQDNVLFMGTLRENLDPHKLRTDAELISAMQRASLIPANGASDASLDEKFNLDSIVGDEGSNFSAGEKQLLALCRALVRSNKIIILDEATSNVDVETDAKVQRTIQTEFTSSTLLCIAHRLNTIAYYDRVIVMDKGTVAEFDTVLNLFDKTDSIFRSLCNEANLSRADIVRIREEQRAAVAAA